MIEPLTLWHGSSHIIEQPQFGAGSPYNDYGLGFYCTEHEELAKEWACAGMGNGFANCYELDTSDLRILDLSASEYTVLNWLVLLVSNRLVQVSSAVARQGIVYLRENFLPECAEADLIKGHRADDSYFSIVRAFVNNTISLDQLGRAMHLGALGEQVMVKSERAFDRLRFVRAEEADASIYAPHRANRDQKAREAFQREAENDDLDGLFMRDIIRERVTNDDPRIR